MKNQEDNKFDGYIKLGKALDDSLDKISIPNKELIDDLRNFIPNYEKSIDVYDDIKEKTQDAIDNSKKLEKEQIKLGKDISNVSCNPYTSVYKPVEYIINKTK